MKIDPPVTATVLSYSGDQDVDRGDVGVIDEVVLAYDWPLHVTFPSGVHDWFTSSELVYKEF